ncbi:MAG TPA: hypothetical protein VM095_16245 [Pyrinomonadaceae bacterium]|nr:hypothetical protein [Pyrinomonadaceae bacterium]
MGLKIFTCPGGHVVIPDTELVLVSRQDGGNLIVVPPREVWDRGELTSAELTLWSFLVAATGKAMLGVLPQLEGGCVNYWDAGNWALNEQAEPKGPKTGREYRKTHLHLLGRSRTATAPAWRWGEAPMFPDYSDRHAWASKFERLTAIECRDILASTEALLTADYGMQATEIAPRTTCSACGYPIPIEPGEQEAQALCSECQTAIS